MQIKEISSILIKIVKNKDIQNASWLIVGKMIQIILSFIVGIFTTRYLGPSNYGIIGYATTYVTFFSPICTLGINSIIVKYFIDNPKEHGEAIGSSIVFRVVASTLSCIVIFIIVNIVDNDSLITEITILCSMGLIFQSFDIISYWFQLKYETRIIAAVTLTGYIITSVYRIVLLIYEMDVRWFAFSTSIDYIVISVLYILFYKKKHGPEFVFSMKKGISLLYKSYHYILSGIMVALYTQIDRVMLKQLQNETIVGYYTLACTVNGMWVFVLSAVIDVMFPTIMTLHKINTEDYKRKNRQLYAFIIFFSIFVSLLFLVFGEFVIGILYGNNYRGAIIPLKILAWGTIFSYLGVARNAWLVCENMQRYIKYLCLISLVLNVVLNYIMIPFWGCVGAAVATLLTQFMTSIGLPVFIKDLRPNVILIKEAFLLQKTGAFNKTKNNK